MQARGIPWTGDSDTQEESKSPMHAVPDVDGTIRRLLHWAGDRDEIRAMLLTSTRAVPDAPVDALSDYDVILSVRDIGPFAADRRWVETFGEVLVAYWDATYPDETHGLLVIGNVVQYADGLKIDFSVWPDAMLPAIAAAGTLPPELDAGYRVLLDKDGGTARLAPPTFAAYRPVRPDEATFQVAVNDFFTDVPYVAKCLLRGDLFPAKWALDHDMKHVYLLPMLEWWIGCAEGWSKPVGALGKGLRRRLPADLWREIESSYADGGMDQNVDALFQTVALYRRVATEVADRLGYAYPIALDERVTAFTQRMLDVGKRSSGARDEPT